MSTLTVPLSPEERQELIDGWVDELVALIVLDEGGGQTPGSLTYVWSREDGTSAMMTVSPSKPGRRASVSPGETPTGLATGRRAAIVFDWGVPDEDVERGRTPDEEYEVIALVGPFPNEDGQWEKLAAFRLLVSRRDELGVQLVGLDSDRRNELIDSSLHALRALTTIGPSHPESRSSPQRAEVHARERTVADERVLVLAALAHALGRETHNLAQRPDLLWQQLYNRLQWEDDRVAAVLAPELPRRTAHGSTPWLRMRTRLPESPALIRTLSHDAEARCCAISPDGSFVVSADMDGGLKLWNPQSGEELHMLAGHDGVTACAVSPDGTFIVSAGLDAMLRLWDPESGEALRTIACHRGRWSEIAARDAGFDVGLSGGAEACAVSPDGTFVLSAGSDGALRLWDPKSGEELRTLIGHDESVEACAVSPDGTFVVSASSDRTLRLWDPLSGSELATFTGHDDQVNACAVSPDGAFVVSASEDGTLKLWDLASASAQDDEWMRRLGHHDEGVNGCAFSPDGTFVVSASMDGMLKAWDPQSGGELRTFVGDDGQIFDCAVSPDGAFVVSAIDEGLELSDPLTGRVFRTLRSHDGEFHSRACAVSPDGAFVCAGGRTLTLWDPESGRELCTLAGHDDHIFGCAVSPDGASIVSASFDGTLKLWDPKSGRELRTLAGHDGYVRDCAVSPEGTFIVSAGNDATLKLWDPKSGRELRTLAGDDFWAERCAVSPDGAFVVAAGGLGLKLWDAEHGVELGLLPLRISCVALHPSVPLAACGDDRGNVHFIELNSAYGPLITTVLDRGAELEVRCPGCGKFRSAEAKWLGQVVSCPGPVCEALLRVNPFILRAPRPAPERDDGVHVQPQRDVGSGRVWRRWRRRGNR